MAKTRAFKQQSIDDTNAQVKDAGILLVAHYKGLTVAEITDLAHQDPCGRGKLQSDEEPAREACACWVRITKKCRICSRGQRQLRMQLIPYRQQKP